mgnify:CR=1 FL=1
MTHPDLQALLRRAARLGRDDTAPTPSVAVAETDNGTLYRYHAASADGTGRPPGAPPLLIVYSLVNRPAILDLNSQRSVVARLGAGGFDVHLLAWRPPGQARRFLGLADYVLGDIEEAVGWLARRYGTAPHVLGVCQGGVLALCHAGIAGLTTPRSLTLLATPVDTSSDNDRLARLARDIDFDALVGATGNIPGQGLATVFASLKPFALGPQRYGGLSALAGADDAAVETFMRMERWMYDGPDLAGQAFAEFAREIYQRNALARGGLVLDGHPVSLARIQRPVFSASALDDHLVPPAATARLPEYLAGPCTSQTLPGGHLGLFISRAAHRRLYPALIDWLHATPSATAGKA